MIRQRTIEIPISSIILDEDIYPRKGIDPLLYAAKKAIGPRQLTEEEAKDTGRRAYIRNLSLSSKDIGKAIGRSRQAVDVYIADLRAATRQDKDLKIFRMNRLGIPQDRIANRLGVKQASIHNHLSKMPVLAKSNKCRFVLGVYCGAGGTKAWLDRTDGLVPGPGRKDDLKKFKELGWGLRAWDQWEFNACDKDLGMNGPVGYQPN